MFRLINGDYTMSTAKYLKKDPAIALKKGTIGALDTGNLAITGDAAKAISGKSFYILTDAPIGTDTVQVLSSENAIFEGKADAAITDAVKNLQCDMVIVSGEQRVDINATTTDVFTILSDNTYTTTRQENVNGVETPVEYVRFRFTKAIS